jgi:hypothetical protein
MPSEAVLEDECCDSTLTAPKALYPTPYSASAANGIDTQHDPNSEMVPGERPRLCHLLQPESIVDTQKSLPSTAAVPEILFAML